MIVFAVSDKGGTGRSVTGCNVLYRAAMRGADTCYVDFDFGSPTSGGIFGIDVLRSGTTSGRGMHAYLEGRVTEPETVDVWTASDRASLRDRPNGSGRMVLLPGDAGGGEFSVDDAHVKRCGRLFRRLEEEFEFTIVDLSSGRSYATQLALAVTGGPAPAVPDHRWLVFHRWTRQHVVAASGLIHGERGILDTGTKLGHDRHELIDRLRLVRTATIDPGGTETALRPAQLAWLDERHQELTQLARELEVGRNLLLGEVPLDPVFQWEEQLLTKSDTRGRRVANDATVEALEKLAADIRDPRAWERL